MEYSIFTVYKAYLEYNYTLSGEMISNGLHYVIRVDCGEGEWIDHWIFNEDGKL